MRIPRIFHPEPLTAGDTVQLCSDAGNHVGRVLRLKPGARLELFTGDGHCYMADIQSVQRSDVTVTVDSALAEDCESPLHLHLGQAVSKGERMEFVIQKAVELGVTEITPLLTERSVVKLDEKRWAKKLQQWQKIAIGACEQCGRNTLPVIHPPLSLDQWLSQSDPQGTPELRLTLHPRAEHSIATLPRPAPDTRLRLLIGPEGGLSDDEISRTTEAAFTEILLGPRVLRTETAALTAIALLQAQFGDLG